MAESKRYYHHYIPGVISKLWEWPLNTLGRYASPYLANLLFLVTPNKVLFDTIPDGGSNILNAPIDDLQQVTDQGNYTTDFLISEQGYTMPQYPQAEGEIVGIMVVKQRDLVYYNQGSITVHRGEFITLDDLVQRIAQYPVPQNPPVITFTIIGHQVEWPNLIAIDFEQTFSDPVLNNGAGFWDLNIYIRSTVNIAETRSLQSDEPYTEEVGVTGNYGGAGYSRKAGYSNVPPGYLVRFEYRYMGQSQLLFAMDYEVPNNAVARHTVYSADVTGSRTRLQLQKKTTPGDGSAAINQTVYLLRTPGETCSLDDAYFNNLDQTAKLSQTTSIEPVATQNKHWQNRDCDGSSDGTYTLSGDPMITGGDDDNSGTPNTPPVAP
ncbi:hypothetical protein GCM10028805_60170 [Spirosoma harenae]